MQRFFFALNFPNFKQTYYMGFLIEIVLRIFVNVINQFTKQDLNDFIEQFPKDVGEKIGEAVKGNLTPIKNWLSESTSNLTLFLTAFTKKKLKYELTLPDNRINEISELINAVLKGIEIIKKPILLKETLGNTNYYSLWSIEGYINNAYNKSSLEITPNSHFSIILIEAKKADYDKLMRYVSNTSQIPKRLLKKSLIVKSIHAEEVRTSSNKIWNKWINKNEKIAINFSVDSYLNQLSDIEKNIELTIEPKSFWKRVKSFFKGA